VVTITDSILTSLDAGKGVILLLLDLSAAFDTIDHNILLQRLSSYFGVTGLALDWINSYLTDRSFTVSVESSTSSPCPLLYGVPQGSVLGPILYTAYTTPLCHVISEHSMNYHFYADDTQIWLPVNFDDSLSLQNSISRIEACLEEISQWMTQNKLHINPDKTELLVISSKYRQKQIPKISIKFQESIIQSTNKARNLGILFDSYLNFHDHISSILKSGYFHLRNIKSASKYLTTKSIETLIHAFVTSRLDNCNAILYNLPVYEIFRLQKLQNCAARIISQTTVRQHITPILLRLHWLPIKYRIMYKILVITHKCIYGTSPTYLKHHSHIYQKHQTIHWQMACNSLYQIC
jgi:hypothetical protein